MVAPSDYVNTKITRRNAKDLNNNIDENINRIQAIINSS